jgi:hypothetical protein
MTLLTRWEPFRELSTMQDRMNPMNRRFRLRRTHRHLGKRPKHRHIVGGTSCDENIPNAGVRFRKCLIRSSLRNRPRRGDNLGEPA